MPDRPPLSFRAVESVETTLRRHASPTVLRLSYRLGYLILRPWWFLTRPHTMGVKAVVRHGDEVLLVRHTYARRDLWDLPGGFLHPEEDAMAAVRRELVEELGVHAEATMLIATTPSRHDHKREVLFAFVVDVPDRGMVPSVAEIADARWFPHDALPPGAGPFTRRMVARAYWERWDDTPSAAGEREVTRSATK